MKRALLLFLILLPLLGAAQSQSATVYVLTQYGFPNWSKWLWVDGEHQTTMSNDEIMKIRWLGIRSDAQKNTWVKVNFEEAGRHHFCLQAHDHLADFTVATSPGETYYLLFKWEGKIDVWLKPELIDQESAQKLMDDTEKWLHYDDINVAKIAAASPARAKQASSSSSSKKSKKTKK